MSNPTTTDYPKIKYQSIPVTPNTHHAVNPGYVYVKVASPEAESALEGDWHDSAADAIKQKATGKLTPLQYTLLAAQATERGYPAPAPPKWDDTPATDQTQAHPAQSPAMFTAPAPERPQRPGEKESTKR